MPSPRASKVEHGCETLVRNPGAVTTLSTSSRARGARRGRSWPSYFAGAARGRADSGRGALPAGYRPRPNREPCRAGRRLPLLGPAGPRRRRRAPQSPRPTARAGRRNESAGARTAKRAIPPAPDHEASQDRGQGRASRVAARSALRAAPGPRALTRIHRRYRRDGADRDLPFNACPLVQVE